EAALDLQAACIEVEAGGDAQLLLGVERVGDERSRAQHHELRVDRFARTFPGRGPADAAAERDAQRDACGETFACEARVDVRRRGPSVLAFGGPAGCTVGFERRMREREREA